MSGLGSVGNGVGASSSGSAKYDLGYQVGAFVAAFNNQPWTPKSFFDGPRVNAPDLVVFGQGKTYDFFA
jgi:hypothetical protein